MAGKLDGKYGIVARTRMPNVYNNVSDMPAHSAILNMAGIRNLLAYPHEVLTCVLRDEHREAQIRTLRDQLESHVCISLKEIVDYEPLSHLPGARHWALHHQYLCENVIGYLHKHNQSAEERRRNDAFLGFLTTYGLTPPESHYHPAVVTAAITWIARSQTPGANLHHVIAMPLAHGLPPEP
ncbi:hypothetical protein AC579_624 [Pseudocercospora musae]|uniref:Uncharacterized protein n=1 Tax=Pseudocercospora musae TaxID=113226 RepID=A0A139HQF9_9PEZI|nr:hypothetical protein AC579_624 [Pseudocercospora musae]